MHGSAEAVVEQDYQQDGLDGGQGDQRGDPGEAPASRRRRARLLAAAAQEFARAGFERANVDGISLAAGYAKGTIYNYFPSKEELFLAVVEEASAQAAATAPAPVDASAWERLTGALAGFAAGPSTMIHWLACSCASA
jgi:AcrR family transcriptional regulator